MKTQYDIDKADDNFFAVVILCSMIATFVLCMVAFMII